MKRLVSLFLILGMLVFAATAFGNDDVSPCKILDFFKTTSSLKEGLFGFKWNENVTNDIFLNRLSESFKHYVKVDEYGCIDIKLESIHIRNCDKDLDYIIARLDVDYIKIYSHEKYGIYIIDMIKESGFEDHLYHFSKYERDYVYYKYGPENFCWKDYFHRDFILEELYSTYSPGTEYNYKSSGGMLGVLQELNKELEKSSGLINKIFNKKQYIYDKDRWLYDDVLIQFEIVPDPLNSVHEDNNFYYIRRFIHFPTFLKIKEEEKGFVLKFKNFENFNIDNREGNK